MSTRIEEGDWIEDPNSGPKPPAKSRERSPDLGRPVEQIEDITSPPQPVQNSEPVPEGESGLPSNAKPEATADGDLAELWPALSTGPGLWARPEVTALVVLAGGCLALILMAQAMAFLGALDAQPAAIRYGGYVAAIVILCGTAWAVLRLAYSYYRFRTTPRPLYLAQKMLEDRIQLRKRYAAGLNAKLMAELNRFVSQYPVQDEVALKRLLFTDEEIKRLKDAKAELTNGQESAGDADRCHRLDTQFISVLDAAARRQIANYAIRAGAKTAILPTGVLDAAAIIINAAMMTRDLCETYRFRADRAGTWFILSKVFINTFTATQVGNISQGTVDTLFGAHADAVSGALESGVAVALREAGRTIGAKVGEGVVNGILMKRLGDATMRLIRPLPL